MQFLLLVLVLLSVLLFPVIVQATIAIIGVVDKTDAVIDSHEFGKRA